MSEQRYASTMIFPFTTQCCTFQGLGESAIIGIAVGAALIVVAIAIAVVFGVPSIRKKVFPHRDKQHFRMQKG